MIGVGADMGLEQYRFAPAGAAAAIDKVFNDVPDFSDVGMGRDMIAVREDKPREGRRKFSQNRCQLVQFHVLDLYSQSSI